MQLTTLQNRGSCQQRNAQQGCEHNPDGGGEPPILNAPSDKKRHANKRDDCPKTTPEANNNVLISPPRIRFLLHFLHDWRLWHSWWLEDVGPIKFRKTRRTGLMFIRIILVHTLHLSQRFVWGHPLCYSRLTTAHCVCIGSQVEIFPPQASVKRSRYQVSRLLLKKQTGFSYVTGIAGE